MEIMDVNKVMYYCGVECLHPGGLEKSEEMALACRINENSNILDFGCGKGATAFFLAKKYRCNVTGIDSFEKMVKYANHQAEKFCLENKVEFLYQNYLSFTKNTYDIVLLEATASLLDKEQAFPRFINALKRRGYIGTLDFIWKNEPPTKLVEELKELWGGFTTMTLDGWENFYTQQGLKVTKSLDFSKEVPDLEASFSKQLGAVGKAQLGVSIAINPSLIPTLHRYKEILKNNKEYIGYAYIVGRKD